MSILNIIGMGIGYACPMHALGGYHRFIFTLATRSIICSVMDYMILIPNNLIDFALESFTLIVSKINDVV